MGSANSLDEKEIIIITSNTYFQDKTYFDRMQYTHMVIVIPDGAEEYTRTYAAGYVVIRYKMKGQKQEHMFRDNYGLYQAF